MNYEAIESKVNEFVKAMLNEKELEYFSDTKYGVDPALGARCYTLGYMQSMLTQALRMGGDQVQKELFAQMDRRMAVDK